MADQNSNKKKRKKKIVSATYDSFDDLPDDLKINILCRIPLKLLARFTTVSKAWHYFITHLCFPIALPCSGFVVRQETRTVRQQGDLRFWQFSPATSIHGFFYSALKFRVTSKEVLDCCNGLTLFCHCTKKASSYQKLYYYYVVNPMTKQFVTVTKPAPKTSAVRGLDGILLCYFFGVCVFLCSLLFNVLSLLQATCWMNRVEVITALNSLEWNCFVRSNSMMTRKIKMLAAAFCGPFLSWVLYLYCPWLLMACSL